MNVNAKGFFNKPENSTNQYTHEEVLSEVVFDKQEPHRICGLWRSPSITVQLFNVDLTYGNTTLIPYPTNNIYVSTYDDDSTNIDNTQKVLNNYTKTQTLNKWQWDALSTTSGKYETDSLTIQEISQEIRISSILTKTIAGKNYNFYSIPNPLSSSFLSGGYSQLRYRDSNTYWGFLYLWSIPMFKTEEECVLYVNDIIDDSTAVNKDEYFDPDADENDENDNDTDASKYDTSKFNEPQVTPMMVKGASNYYCVNVANVNAFVNWLWNDLIKEGSLSDFLLDSITKINGNMYQNITGLRLFPCNIKKHLTSVETTPIVIGRFSTDISVLDGSKYHPKIGSIDYVIPSAYKNFLDYPPYSTGLLYLPFCGLSPLDMNIFQPGKHLYIDAYVDITTGIIDYAVSVDSDEGGKTLIEQHTGTCGIEIPISYDNASNWLSDFVGNSVRTGIASISSKGATSLGEIASDASGALLDSLDTPTSYSVGSPSPSNGLYFPFEPALILRRPVYQRPSSYSSNVGYPCMKSIKPKSLRGYTIMENPVVKYGHSKNSDGDTILPTKNEMDMIYQALTSGVYL